MKTPEEIWMEINTFECALGRVTPETCKKLRSRPTVKDILEKKVKDVVILPDNRYLTKPAQCVNCKDWKRLSQEVYEKRKKQKEVLTMGKIITCKVCGQQTVHHAKGMCQKCYNKLKKSQRDSSDAEEEKEQKRLRIELDFSNCPDLYEWIKQKAKDEMRELNSQILWELKLAKQLTDPQEV